MESWIPTVIAAATLEITIIAAFMIFERRLSACVTREEHEKICVNRQSELTSLLGALKESIDTNEERSANTRHAIRTEVAVVGTKLAVLTERTDNLGKQITAVSGKVDTLQISANSANSR